MSSAGRLSIAEGADGKQHVIASQTYPRSRMPDQMSLSFRPLWVAVAHELKAGVIEVGVVVIGLDDAKVLCKNLSCTLT
jgi:hypothetical protein